MKYSNLFILLELSILLLTTCGPEAENGNGINQNHPGASASVGQPAQNEPAQAVPSPTPRPTATATPAQSIDKLVCNEPVPYKTDGGKPYNNIPCSLTLPLNYQSKLEIYVDGELGVLGKDYLLIDHGKGGFTLVPEHADFD